MSKLFKVFTCITLAVALSISNFGQSIVLADDTAELTTEQKNAIEMLNHITVLTKEINESKNSRVFMENAYSELINNIDPQAVDDETLYYMDGLLDTMEHYRMLNVKRERLQYIYEQNQAQSMRAAIPNPVGLLSAVQSFNPVKLVGSVVYMAVDSVSSYQNYTAEAEKQYMQEGWALDEEEAQALHDSRKSAFTYMVRMVKQYKLPSDMTLTEETVDDFVGSESNPLTSRIHFLESNRETYKAYRGYYILLAESYFEDQQYLNCIREIKNYDQMDTHIFRKDYELAKVLPLAIASAKTFYKPNKYVPYAASQAKRIVDNTRNDDWALRYFAAQVYADLYTETKDESYLKKAYDIVLDSVNYLRPKQEELNKKYMAKVVEETAPKDATKEQKKSIEEYNDMLEEVRETELPPVCEPLLLNCELLFAVADKLKLSESAKKDIDRLIHPDEKRLFLSVSLDDKFWYNNPNKSEDLNSIEYGGCAIVLPARFLTQDSTIKVSVKGADGSSKAEFDDWKLKEVERETDEDISTFEAFYLSEKAEDYSWVPNETITITILSKDDLGKKYTLKYKTQGTKNEWYNYLQVWQGQKNHWYDYAKVWENSVVFESVK